MRWVTGAILMLACGMIGFGGEPIKDTEIEAVMKKAATRQKAAAKKLRKPVRFTNSIGMKLKLIPAGEFMMGSGRVPKELRKSPEELVRMYGFPENYDKYFENEQPRYQVRISKPFYLGETEVTQGQYMAVMSEEHWSGGKLKREGSDYPATYVSWQDAVISCKRLSEQEGRTYRLPERAEWEYACRGGTTTAYHFGDGFSQLSDYAWFDDNTCKTYELYAHKVGQKKPNAFGIYDMHGNVHEWCADNYHGFSDQDNSSTDIATEDTSRSSRVVCGGSWISPARHCLSWAHWGHHWWARDYSHGFRVATSVP